MSRYLQSATPLLLSNDLLITVNIYYTKSLCQTAPWKVINPYTAHEISSPHESWDLLLWPSQFHFTEVNIFITGKDSIQALKSTKLHCCFSAHPLLAAAAHFPSSEITSSKPGLCLDLNSALWLSFVNDCRLCSLTLLAQKESDISRVWHQRVCDLTTNLTPPTSPFDASALALFSSLSVFVFLPGPMRKASYCADWTGNQCFHKREVAENVFGENKFS